MPGLTETYETYADFAAATVGGGIETVTLLGYYAVGDGGEGDWRRAAGSQSWVRTLHLVKWEPVPGAGLRWLQLGILPDSGAITIGTNSHPDGAYDIPMFSFPTQTDYGPLIQASWDFGAHYRVPVYAAYGGDDQAVHTAQTLIVPDNLEFSGINGANIFDQYGTITDVNRTWLRAVDEMDGEVSVINFATSSSTPTHNTRLRDFVIDYNSERWGDTGDGNLPAFISGDCITVSYVDGNSLENVGGINPYRHGINLTSVTSTSGTLHTPPEVTDRPINVQWKGVWAAYCGDDAITTHGCGTEGEFNILIDDAAGYHARATYSTDSNAVEIDDDSIGVIVRNLRGVNCRKALEIKGHGDSKAARHIRVEGVVYSWDCAFAVEIRHIEYMEVEDPTSPTAYDVSIEEVCYGNPKSVNEWQQPRGVQVSAYKNVKIGRIVCDAGTNEVLDTDVSTVVRIQDKGRDVEIETIVTNGFKAWNRGFSVADTSGVPGETSYVKCGQVTHYDGPITGIAHAGGCALYLDSWSMDTTGSGDTGILGVSSDQSALLYLGNGVQIVGSGYPVKYDIDQDYLPARQHQTMARLDIELPAVSTGGVTTTPQTALNLRWYDPGQNIGLGEGLKISFQGPDAAGTGLNELAYVASYKADETDADQATNLIFGTRSAGGVLSTCLTLKSNGALQTHFGRIRALRRVTASGSVTVTATDEVVVVAKGTGAATAVSLPSSPETGREYVIKDGKGDAATNNITISPSSGNIDGSATLVISTNYGRATLIHDGTKWLTK